MHVIARCCLQGASCGLTLGFIVVCAEVIRRPSPVAAQANDANIADVVRARRFEVVDTTGKVRALLQVTKGGYTHLELFSESSAPPMRGAGLPQTDTASVGELRLTVDEHMGGAVSLR